MQKNIPEYLIVHHIGGILHFENYDSSGQTLEEINNHHKARDFNLSELGYYVGYHYLIFPDGKIVQTRSEDEMGCHVIGQNFSSIGVCLIGNFSRGIWLNHCVPTGEQVKSLKKLGSDICKKYNIPLNKIVPHRAFSNTECNGKNMGESWTRDLIAVVLEAEENIKKELLQKKKGILQILKELYIKLLRLLFKTKVGKIFGGEISLKEDN